MKVKKVDMPYYKNVEGLRQAVDPGIFYMKYESMPILCWDTTLGPYPSLKTGQHRRLALMRKNNIPDLYFINDEIDEKNKLVSGPPIHHIDRAINFRLAASRNTGGECAL